MRNVECREMKGKARERTTGELTLPLSKWDAWEDVLDVMESKEAVRVIANISIWLILRLDGTPVEIDRGMIELAYAAIFRSRWGIACHAL